MILSQLGHHNGGNALHQRTSSMVLTLCLKDRHEWRRRRCSESAAAHAQMTAQSSIKCKIQPENHTNWASSTPPVLTGSLADHETNNGKQRKCVPFRLYFFPMLIKKKLSSPTSTDLAMSRLVSCARVMISAHDIAVPIQFRLVDTCAPQFSYSSTSFSLLYQLFWRSPMACIWIVRLLHLD